MRDVKVKLNPNAFKQGPKMDELSRDIRVISEEIQSYKQRVTSSIVEIGKRLRHVKEYDLTHGRWLDWLASLQIEARQAQRFMQAYEQFGDTSASTHLESGKIIEMLTLPPEVDRAEFIEKKHRVPSTGEEKTVEEMSTREIREVVREERRAAGLVKEKTPKHLDVDRELAVPLKVELADIGEDDPLNEVVRALKNLIPDIKELVRHNALSLDIAVKVGQLSPAAQLTVKPFLGKGASLVEVILDIVVFCTENDLPTWVVSETVRFREEVETVRGLFLGMGSLLRGVEIQELITRFGRLIEEESLHIEEEDLREQFRSCFDELGRIRSEIGREYEKFNAGSKSRSGGFSRPTTQAPKSEGPRHVLGIAQEAPIEEVKVKYRELMKVLHPDKGGSSYLFQAVKAAYEAICEEERSQATRTA
ncbi:DUF3102 domain-containing protein [Brevibacillus sp. BC25]|uniref:DUF3102 domain-containing protein n=1 Tax=Brevibacillus sp. BC25 TaxID=1144308 RepID=UPI000270DD68|nr:DUF3102 domain-containing protein [Brevibacillus sp. BC25]EJL31793.1 DnaJ-class molecular chaperone with C-terminal Zn finger domain [Brevibacillus sp. BC25]